MDKAKRQTEDVAEQAKRQTRDLAAQTREQVIQQAAGQQGRAASSVHDLADGLSQMADQAPSQSGLAADLACQAAEKLHAVGSHLDRREPGELIEDVRTFARERPGTFLAGAFLGGFVTGRVVRSMAAAQLSPQRMEARRAPASAGPTSSTHQDTDIPVGVGATSAGGVTSAGGATSAGGEGYPTRFEDEPGRLAAEREVADVATSPRSEAAPSRDAGSGGRQREGG
jgi:hypothetical protein